MDKEYIIITSELAALKKDVKIHSDYFDALYNDIKNIVDTLNLYKNKYNSLADDVAKLCKIMQESIKEKILEEIEGL